MLVVHHLGISQSERIVWLLEELGLDYKLVKYTRDPVLSPKSLTELPGNDTGQSPFIEDTDAGITLSESLAISDYILSRYGKGQLMLKADHRNFSDYLYWYHFSNSSMQAAFVTCMFLSLADPPIPQDAMISQFADKRLHGALKHMGSRLKDNKWLAGEEFTAADVMSVYTVTTQRYFGPQVNLAGYDNLLRWLKDCSQRPAYQRAMEKGDPEMKLLLEAEPPKVGMMQAGGTTSDHWKK